jgi:hypothetical protein
LIAGYDLPRRCTLYRFRDDRSWQVGRPMGRGCGHPQMISLFPVFSSASWIAHIFNFINHNKYLLVIGQGALFKIFRVHYLFLPNVHGGYSCDNNYTIHWSVSYILFMFKNFLLKTWLLNFQLSYCLGGDTVCVFLLFCRALRSSIPHPTWPP